jgi:dGTP triphosphohydrolase
LARLYSDSVYYDRAREFNDPNFGISESCSKKNTLTKLARMSRVRHNAKSIENRYNSLKILTKLFETFCPLTKGRHFEKDKLGFIQGW